MARDSQSAAAVATIAPAKVEKKPKEKAVPYWIGLIRNPWFEFIALAGLDVSLITHKPTWDSNANQWVKVPQRGRILTVTQTQVEALIAAANRKTVRPSDPAKLIDSNADLEPDERDFPVARIVYAVPYVSQMRDHDSPDPQPIGAGLEIEPEVEKAIADAATAPKK